MPHIPFYLDDRPAYFGGFKRDYAESDFALFGVPFDGTSSYRPGSRFGPDAIREASANIETWSWRTGTDFEELRLHDLGNLAVVHGDAGETIRRVGDTVEDIVSTRKIPIMVGGEHLMTLGAAKAIKGCTFVSFDAHFDLRDEYLSNRLSHACVMRRVMEEEGKDRVIFCGVRATFGEELRWVKENGIKFMTSRDLLREGTKSSSSWLREALKGSEKVYITIDMDVIDPSYAPGVGNPEPEGIHPSLLLDMLQEVIDERVVGFDIVEVAPKYDMGITALLASKMIFEICTMMKRK
ncbi:MAG: agmatinase [Candidatus Verstraetearchaeota archaeon]|nr:agmatinase [Candidatus Verstraetearchaeota archaeon]